MIKTPTRRSTHAFFLLTLCLLIAACASPTPDAPTAAPLQVTAGSQPTDPDFNLVGLQRAAADFLNAWSTDNFDAMYPMLVVNSRDAFPVTQFRAQYDSAESKMTVNPGGKQYQLLSGLIDGTRGIIAYDMTFNTRLFGEFTDSGRELNLAWTNDGWRIAWSPGDIIAELKDGAVLEAETNQPNRGNIYDRDGEVIADQGGRIVVVTLYTREYPTGDPDACFQRIAALFPQRDAAALHTAYDRFSNQDFAFEIGEVALERLQPAQAGLEQVCTLTYTNRPTRRYVAGGLAPHLVGYVGPIPAEQVDEWTQRGYAQDALIGIDGIERYWEETLAGRGQAILRIRRTDGTTRVLAESQAVPSQSVYLTLDRRLQEATQNALISAFETAYWGRTANGGAAIVMNVRTGEILASASYPTFNVDAFNPYTPRTDAAEQIATWQADPRKPTFNRAMLAQLPPGSVFKIVSMIAAADSGAYTLKTRLACGGVWNGTPMGDRTRTDWLKTGHGSITLQQSLTGSCNIYYWNIGWKLNGIDENLLTNYAKEMGLGAKTGTRDVNESDGLLPDPATHADRNLGIPWRASDSLNTVIGQGDVLATPLQIVRMVSAVANGGTLYEPRLVYKVGMIGQTSTPIEPVVQRQVKVSPEVLAGVRTAMCEVTTNPTLGTAYFVYKDLKTVSVCGKTGTAENPPYITTAWFAAYAGRTQTEPEIAVAVVVERGGEGSWVASPIVRRIIETYYKLPITPWPAWYGSSELVPGATPVMDE